MKKLLLILSVAVMSCTKEQIEEVQSNILIDMMTNGQWKVSRLASANTDASAQFNGYSFQFKKDNTVDAIRNGAVIATGSWTASLANQTITSSFSGAGANPTISLLNGTWKIEKSAPSYVEAWQNTGGERWDLRLDKL